MNNRGHVQQPYYSNSLAIRQEIQRFESVHPSIYAIYDHLELMPDPLLAQQIREHVVCIEGSLIVKLGYSVHSREVLCNDYIAHILDLS
ncbi:putative gtpase-activating protein centaurin gamma [Trichonephila inaurata madagascariensis]|uniref:Putative gtpase-activating protein centaurin gamma n=1 Tax=Trichonephila inaurata madagascariensis TaxID=2747483 RepID=A0A8X6WV26_9ARAC|nr:putative gtpase-activating protein centaurin gamma [Trichonephila inaurata madagascariensis]